MNFYLDTEFNYTSKKQTKLLGINIGKPIPAALDLISIGIYQPQLDLTYFALNADCDVKAVWNKKEDGVYWLRDNVLYPIYKRYIQGDHQNHMPFTLGTMKRIFEGYGQTMAGIKREVLRFVNDCCNAKEKLCGEQNVKPKFWAYYADYDWVVFCSIFGRMIDLPRNFPMYCNDLKQELDRVVEDKLQHIEEKAQGKSRFEQALDLVKAMPEYPVNEYEHQADGDAKWNAKLHVFIEWVKSSFITIKKEGDGRVERKALPE